MCETIPPLQHGNTTCIAPIKETTDSTCSFFCKKGFEIHGSTSRTCQPNHKWNGTITKCESKLLIGFSSLEEYNSNFNDQSYLAFTVT